MIMRGVRVFVVVMMAMAVIMIVRVFVMRVMRLAMLMVMVMMLVVMVLVTSVLMVVVLMTMFVIMMMVVSAMVVLKIVGNFRACRVHMVGGHRVMQMIVPVRVEVDVHVFVTVGAVNVPMCMQKRRDDAPVLGIHLAGTEFFVQQLVRHQC